MRLVAGALALTAWSCVWLGASCVLRPAPLASNPALGGTDASSAVPPSAGNNLLKNSTFEDGTSLPWMTSFSQPADGAANVKKGALCVNVTNKGSNPWDAQVRHREMVIQKGHTYTVQFRAFASAPTRARTKVGMSGPPYAEYWS